jgi:hypothetical protein
MRDLSWGFPVGQLLASSVICATGRSGPESFLRKACPELAEGWESTPQIFGNDLPTDWILALRQAQGSLSRECLRAAKGRVRKRHSARFWPPPLSPASG